MADPRPDTLALGRARLAELGKQPSTAKIRWSTSLEDVHPHGDLCIVATQAQGHLNFWVDSRSYNIVEMTHQIWVLAVCDFIISEAESSAVRGEPRVVKN